jgi:hypothetical protein
MNSAATAVGRFVRRTSLGGDEYRVNFRQIDCDVLDALASDEACAVTPLIGKIYIRLVRAHSSCWEREGVLRFVGEDREGKALTAWEQLVELTGVANSTLSKALAWMHKTGIIGYDARKNGVGIRIFINRARSSIRKREQKILRLVPAPAVSSPAPSFGTTFKEGGLREDLEKDINPRAHSRAADTPGAVGTPSPADDARRQPSRQDALRAVAAPPTQISIGQVVGMVKLELEPVITATCNAAIANACRNQASLNREWLEKAGIPKAVRVAQRAAFDVLRSQGVISGQTPNAANVGAYVASKDGEELGSEVCKIAEFLGETLNEIRQVAAEGGVSERPEMRAAFSQVEKDLGDLRSQIALNDNRMPLDLEEIESRLAAAEDAIVEALWRSSDPVEIQSMLSDGSVKLQRYENTMGPGVYGDNLRRYVASRLRERHGIPRLSLFYLTPTSS